MCYNIFKSLVHFQATANKCFILIITFWFNPLDYWNLLNYKETSINNSINIKIKERNAGWMTKENILTDWKGINITYSLWSSLIISRHRYALWMLITITFEHNDHKIFFSQNVPFSAFVFHLGGNTAPKFPRHSNYVFIWHISVISFKHLRPPTSELSFTK